jgi:hypothetical protein
MEDQAMDMPLLVEIIAYAPTAFYHCQHCEVVWHEIKASGPIHQEQVASSLPDDLIQEYQEISNWADELFRRYADRVTVQVIDAASLEGVLKSLRYGVHRYPAVIVNRRARFTRQAFERASDEIARALGSPQPSSP